MREESHACQHTLTAKNLPAFELASATRKTRGIGQSFVPQLGSKRELLTVSPVSVYPKVQSVAQHIQITPKGSLTADERAKAKGRKVRTETVRREFLSGIRGVCYLRGDEDIESRVVSALKAPTEGDRYGVPFLGDNNFFLEELELVPQREEAVQWLVDAGDGENIERPIRLTNWVDRMSEETRYGRFVTLPGSILEPPPGAWVKVGPNS